jgi:hypothetical protein
MMKHLRPYLPVILIVIPVIVLILIRSLAPGNFKPDASKHAEASFSGTNVLTRQQLAAHAGKPYFVKLVPDEARQANSSPDTLIVAASRLLEKENLRAIRNHQGPVLLVSDDKATAAKAWMILSQMGYRDLFILSEKDSSEVFKYKFRPDTTAGI